MIRIALLGIMTVLLCMIFQGRKPEYAMLLSISMCFFIFFLIVGRLETVVELFQKLTGQLKLDPTYGRIILKITGITFVSEITSNICKDAGCHAISGQIELVGKVIILTMSFPIFLSILDTVDSFL